jgi:hypothetical protein
MNSVSTREASDDQSQLSTKHRIVFSRNNTYNSDYSLGTFLDNFQTIPTTPSRIRQYSQSTGDGGGGGGGGGGGDGDGEQESIQSITHCRSGGNFNEMFNNHLNGGQDISTINYILFCIAFSLTVAPIICSIIFAPAVIGDEIGALGNGCFFLCYAFFSLFFSKSIVYMLGCIKSFFLGHFGSYFYMISFILFANEYYTHKSIFFISTAIGGLSQGLLWSAHSKYFSKCSQMMISSMNHKEIENMHRTLSTRFASFYFMILMGVFLTCTLVISNPAQIHQSIVSLALPVYSATQVISLMIYYFLDHYGDVGNILYPSAPSLTFFYPSSASVSGPKPFQEFFHMIMSTRSLPKRMKIKLAL